MSDVEQIEQMIWLPRCTSVSVERKRDVVTVARRGELSRAEAAADFRELRVVPDRRVVEGCRCR